MCLQGCAEKLPGQPTSKKTERNFVTVHPFIRMILLHLPHSHHCVKIKLRQDKHAVLTRSYCLDGSDDVKIAQKRWAFTQESEIIHYKTVNFSMVELYFHCETTVHQLLYLFII